MDGFAWSELLSNWYGWERRAPYRLFGFGGGQMYPCGTVRRGDHVVAESWPGSSVTVGNPGICV